MDFNQKAHIWESISLSQKQAADDLIKLLNVQSKDKILDIGCGTGYLTDKLYQLSNYTSGMDNADNMIEVAKELRPHINFFTGDAEELNYDEQYDLITTNAVTYYFKDIAGTFKKFHKALKKNGHYALQSQVLRTPQFSYAFTKLEQDSVTRDVFSTFKLPINILDIPDLVCILKSQNFEIQHTQLIEYETEYTIEQAMDVFKSGAATPYLNPTAYSVPLTEEYINGFWRVIETSLKEQLSNNKIILGFPRCFIIAKKC